MTFFDGVFTTLFSLIILGIACWLGFALGYNSGESDSKKINIETLKPGAKIETPDGVMMVRKVDERV